MSFTEGTGSAGDATIGAEPFLDPETEARIAAGLVEAHETNLRETRLNIELAQAKLAVAERDLADAVANLAAVEAELESLEEGEN